MKLTRHATFLSAAVVAFAAIFGSVLAQGASGQSEAWDLALSGRADEAFTVLAEGAEGSQELRAALERRDEHLKTIETKRAERLVEARKELEENLAEGETVLALRNAVEIHTLSDDKHAVMNSPGSAIL